MQNWIVKCPKCGYVTIQSAIQPQRCAATRVVGACVTRCRENLTEVRSTRGAK